MILYFPFKNLKMVLERIEFVNFYERSGVISAGLTVSVKRAIVRRDINWRGSKTDIFSDFYVFTLGKCGMK